MPVVTKPAIKNAGKEQTLGQQTMKKHISIALAGLLLGTAAQAAMLYVGKRVAVPKHIKGFAHNLVRRQGTCRLAPRSSRFTSPLYAVGPWPQARV